MDESGKIARVIRTTPFVPRFICAAEDGTVWAFGFERDQRGATVTAGPMLRQYSFATGMLRGTFDRSSVKQAWYPVGGRYPGDVVLRCTSQKVGIYSGPSGEWVEFDLSTNKLGRWRLSAPPKSVLVTGFAFTESGEVFTSLYDSSKPGKPVVGLFQLQLDSSHAGRWLPVEGTLKFYHDPSLSISKLMGSDGTDLVYLSRPLPSNTLAWSHVLTRDARRPEPHQ